MSARKGSQPQQKKPLTGGKAPAMKSRAKTQAEQQLTKGKFDFKIECDCGTVVPIHSQVLPAKFDRTHVQNNKISVAYPLNIVVIVGYFMYSETIIDRDMWESVLDSWNETLEVEIEPRWEDLSQKHWAWIYTLSKVFSLDDLLKKSYQNFLLHFFKVETGTRQVLPQDKTGTQCIPRTKSPRDYSCSPDAAKRLNDMILDLSTHTDVCTAFERHIFYVVLGITHNSQYPREELRPVLDKFAGRAAYFKLEPRDKCQNCETQLYDISSNVGSPETDQGYFIFCERCFTAVERSSETSAGPDAVGHKPHQTSKRKRSGSHGPDSESGKRGRFKRGIARSSGKR